MPVLPAFCLYSFSFYLTAGIPANAADPRPIKRIYAESTFGVKYSQGRVVSDAGGDGPCGQAPVPGREHGRGGCSSGEGLRHGGHPAPEPCRRLGTTTADRPSPTMREKRETVSKSPAFSVDQFISQFPKTRLSNAQPAPTCPHRRARKSPPPCCASPSWPYPP